MMESGSWCLDLECINQCKDSDSVMSFFPAGFVTKQRNNNTVRWIYDYISNALTEN